MRIVQIAVVVVVMLLAAAGVARADAKARADAYDAKALAELRATNPEAVPDFEAALKAHNEGDLQRALAALTRVNDAAPQFTPAMRRRVGILAWTGEHDEAVKLAREAVKIQDSPENHLALARALAHRPNGGHVTRSEANDALTYIRDRSTQEPDDVSVQLAYCEIAIGAEAIPDLQACVGRAIQAAPDEAEPYLYASLAAMTRGDRASAEAYAEKAKAHGADPRALEFLDKLQSESEPLLWKWAKRLFYAIGAWGAVMLLLFAIGNAFSKRTLALAEELAATRGETATSATLRRWYRVLLMFASAFYYVSLPLALVLTVLAGAVVLYAILYVGHVPVGLIVVTLTIVLYTIKSVVQSLVVRGKEEDPGTLVNLEKHRGLATILREVADRVGTRPVDRVYLTPKADVSVFERGGMLAEWRGTTERVLLLGVGVLEGMKLQPFKAILAHEYGHFSNRDTAGGKIALFVRRSLLLTALGMARSGAATIYNPAWLFVRAFGKVFLRISQGASRLQEVMADRVAAAAYGPEAFAAGLNHVIRREFEINAHINATLREVTEKNLPLPNLYRFTPVNKLEEDIAAKIAQALDAEPSPYDSHPKPADRIRWMQNVKSSLVPGPLDAADAWSLFVDREMIEARVTDDVRRELAMRGIRIAEAPAAAEKAA